MPRRKTDPATQLEEQRQRLKAQEDAIEHQKRAVQQALDALDLATGRAVRECAAGRLDTDQLLALITRGLAQLDADPGLKEALVREGKALAFRAGQRRSKPNGNGQHHAPGVPAGSAAPVPAGEGAADLLEPLATGHPGPRQSPET